jgi:hypothetical protein
LARRWEQADFVPPSATPVRPVVPPALPPAATQRHTVPLLWIVGAVAVTGLAVAGYWLFRSERERDRADRERDRIALANQVVAAKVEAARAHVARRHFDEALKVLDDALATEHATRLDDARLALVQARQGQANLLLDEASAAVARRNVDRARRLLQEYLAHPYADRPRQATVLLDELARATADDDAVRLLARLPDDKLAEFADSGRLADGEEFTDEGMRGLYQDTLRRHLLKELQRRETLREAARAEVRRREREQANREERLLASPLYLEVRAFSATVRKQLRAENLRRVQEARSRELFLDSTGVNDPAEREKARQALRSGRDREDIAFAVARKRAAVKKDYRQSPDYDRSEEETFDRLVDHSLDRLLADVAGGTGP